MFAVVRWRSQPSWSLSAHCSAACSAGLRLCGDRGVVDRVGRDVGVVGAVRGEAAADGCGMTDPAGVHADQVVAVGDAAGQALGHQQRGERKPGPAGAARVEHEHAPPLVRVGGGQPGDGEVDLLALRVGVVQRYGHGGAPQLGRSGFGHDVIGALAPLHLPRLRLLGGGGHGGRRAAQAENHQKGQDLADSALSFIHVQSPHTGSGSVVEAIPLRALGAWSTPFCVEPARG